MTQSQTKRCPGCKLTKPTSEFAVRRASPDGLQTRCRDCRSVIAKRVTPEARREYQATFKTKNPGRIQELNRESHARHRERRIAGVRDWESRNPELALSYRKAQRHKRRAIEAAGTLTFDQWLAILEQFDWRCGYCLVKLTSPTMDHVDPVSRGGQHTAENVIPSCLACNLRKYDKPIWCMLSGKRIRRGQDKGERSQKRPT